MYPLPVVVWQFHRISLIAELKIVKVVRPFTWKIFAVIYLKEVQSAEEDEEDAKDPLRKRLKKKGKKRQKKKKKLMKKRGKKAFAKMKVPLHFFPALVFEF